MLVPQQIDERRKRLGLLQVRECQRYRVPDHRAIRRAEQLQETRGGADLMARSQPAGSVSDNIGIAAIERSQ